MSFIQIPTIPATAEVTFTSPQEIVINKDDDSITAHQGGAWNITNVSGTVSLPTGAATAALQTQPGVDIGDVTINNASGGSAVNIQDGGNSLTVDGTVAATQSGNWSTRLQDGSGNAVTSQASSAQRALDVGINVVGVQVDPRAASPGTLTDFSGSATSTSATILAANPSRKYLLIQNSTANIMWINFTSAATAASPSIRLGAGETFTMEGSFVSTELITAIRNATVNVAFTGKEGT